MKNVGLQVYTIRDWFTDEEHIKEAFEKIAKMGYTEAQTAGDFNIPVESYAKYAKDAGVKIVGTHYVWEKIRDDIEETIRIHDVLGTKNVGIGGMPKEPRTSKEELLKFIDEFNAAAKEYAARGYKLTYHNHSFEFKKFDGKTIMDYLIEGFDKDNISFVLDTYWLQHGGVDIRRMLERLAGRVDILHLKDMGAVAGGELGNQPYITDVGNGNIDFADIVDTAEKTGVKYFVVEQDGNYEVDSMTSAEQSIKYLLENVVK